MTAQRLQSALEIVSVTRLIDAPCLRQKVKNRSRLKRIDSYASVCSTTHETALIGYELVRICRDMIVVMKQKLTTWVCGFQS